jgi:hypothetical protein
MGGARLSAHHAVSKARQDHLRRPQQDAVNRASM